jgi:two-component system, chemotaxis family, protein-glutamate methylesterase/glutaminase
MSTSFESRRRVLLVDDDRQFLESMERVLGALSHGSWEIHLAENPARVLELLQEHTVHLVVIDVEMPVLDGIQLLGLLNRRFPQILKVVLTGFGSESIRAACLSNGAELFLEKPRCASEQESLFAALNELMRSRPEEGFHGVLRRVGLVDVIQLECLCRHSSVLEIKSSRRKGVIYIEDGTIIHAQCGTLVGQEALNKMLRLSRGEFRLRSYVAPPERSFDGSWESTLMEAARARDESGQLGEGDTLFWKASHKEPLEAQTSSGEPRQE